MSRERTFLAIKPDGVRRRLVAEIVRRFEKRGYVMVACKLIMPTRELLEKHYEEHKGKSFLPGLLEYMEKGPVFAMVWEGQNIISEARAMMGATRPDQAAIGTIRKDFCQNQERNIIHGSDSLESAKREIDLWFSPGELCDYDPCDRAMGY